MKSWKLFCRSFLFLTRIDLSRARMLNPSVVIDECSNSTYHPGVPIEVPLGLAVKYTYLEPKLMVAGGFAYFVRDKSLRICIYAISAQMREPNCVRQVRVTTG
jgi:hypothetical protein